MFYRYYTRIRDFLRGIPKGIFNIIKWFPLIWGDRDWDYFYFLHLMKFKFENMEKYFRNSDISANNENISRNIHICVLLLNRIMEIDRDYHDNAFIHHDKKWGKILMGSERIPGTKLSKLLITRENIKTPEDEARETKEYRRLSNHVVKMERQDVELLFKILSKRLKMWWD